MAKFILFTKYVDSSDILISVDDIKSISPISLLWDGYMKDCANIEYNEESVRVVAGFNDIIEALSESDTFIINMSINSNIEEDQDEPDIPDPVDPVDPDDPDSPVREKITLYYVYDRFERSSGPQYIMNASYNENYGGIVVSVNSGSYLYKKQFNYNENKNYWITCYCHYKPENWRITNIYKGHKLENIDNLWVFDSYDAAVEFADRCNSIIAQHYGYNNIEDVVEWAGVYCSIPEEIELDNNYVIIAKGPTEPI